MSDRKIPTHNLLIDCHDLHAELLDLEAGTVRQSHRPISRDAYEALTLPPNFIRVGIGAGIMDSYYFRRSPGADTDGPISVRDVEGHLFIHRANPPKAGPRSPVGEDPKLLRVDKDHSLLFEARPRLTSSISQIQRKPGSSRTERAFRVPSSSSAPHVPSGTRDAVERPARVAAG